MQKKTTNPPLVDLAAAAQIISDGGVLAYPTEAVFGLGCDPGNPQALQRLLDIKARDPAKGLILIAANMAQLAPWIQPLEPKQLDRIGDSWPGPVTWILPASPNAPSALTGGRATIAARVSAHPPVVELCLAANTAIVSTSANLSGASPACHPEQLHSLVGLDACFDASVGQLESPTPIFDATTGAQLRF